MGVEIKKLSMTIIMGIFGIFMVLPFLWMLTTSFKLESDVFNYPIEWIPPTWNAIENYQEVLLGRYPFFLYYWNSIKVTLGTTCLSVLVSSMAAYGFSKIRFRGSNLLFFIVLASIMIPSQATLVPQFLLYRSLGLFDTHTGLILLNSFSVFGTFLLRQFFMGISNEYIESAKIDGAGHFTIFFRIGLPLLLPAIATYGILRFIWTWNDYQYPLIFLRSDTKMTLQLGLAQFADLTGVHYSLVMAGSVIAILPLLIIFIFGQKHVIAGIQAGGLKG
ncbi:carbohydrate ABC transporter permease [Bacillus sp. IITD106]|nr:carbohydrate ABC transporter permease [Bacillus sp. IITD106]